jgi:hypothetical protein
MENGVVRGRKFDLPGCSQSESSWTGFGSIAKTGNPPTLSVLSLQGLAELDLRRERLWCISET